MPLSAYRFAIWRATITLAYTSGSDHVMPERQLYAPAQRGRDRPKTHMLALEVEALQAELGPRGAVLERVPVENVPVCAARGDDDDPRVVVGGRLDALEQGGHEELGEEEGADDVGAPLEVVAVLGELLDGREHYASNKNRWG